MWAFEIINWKLHLYGKLFYIRQILQLSQFYRVSLSDLRASLTKYLWKTSFNKFRRKSKTPTASKWSFLWHYLMSLTNITRYASKSVTIKSWKMKNCKNVNNNKKLVKQFLGGIFPGRNFPEGIFPGGQFSGEQFFGGLFPDTKQMSGWYLKSTRSYIRHRLVQSMEFPWSKAELSYLRWFIFAPVCSFSDNWQIIWTDEYVNAPIVKWNVSIKNKFSDIRSRIKSCLMILLHQMLHFKWQWPSLQIQTKISVRCKNLEMKQIEWK